MPDVQLEISAARGAQDGTWRMEIRDRKSRELLAEFRIPPEEAWKLTGGAVVRAEGSVSPNLHRVGMQMVNDSISYEYNQFAALDRTELLSQAELRARGDMPGWETYEPRATNFGVQVVVRKWEKL